MPGFDNQSVRRISDAVRYVEHHLYPHQVIPGTRSSYSPQTGAITVYNGSASVAHRADVLGIGPPSNTPSVYGEAEFFTEPVYACYPYNESTHHGNFVILLEDIDGFSVGLGIAAGVVQCRVYVDPDKAIPTTAGPENATTSSLTGGKPGAKIKWLESGTGIKRALVSIGAGGGGGGRTLQGTLNEDLTVDMVEVEITPIRWTGDEDPSDEHGHLVVTNPPDLQSLHDDRFIFVGNEDGWCKATYYDNEGFWYLDEVQTPYRRPVGPSPGGS